MANTKKGAEYEVFVHEYLCTLDTTQNSYLWKKVPEQILHEANLITDYNKHRINKKDPETNTLQDIGIDIVVHTKYNGSVELRKMKNKILLT